MKEDIPKIKDEKVREALDSLPEINQSVLLMRFWDYRTIDQIAKRKRMTWAQANRLIDESLIKLKRVLVKEYLGEQR